MGILIFINIFLVVKNIDIYESYIKNLGMGW